MGNKKELIKVLNKYIALYIIITQFLYVLKCAESSVIILCLYGMWLISAIMIDGKYLKILISKTYLLIIFLGIIFLKIMKSKHYSSGFYGTLEIPIAYINMYIYYSMFIFFKLINENLNLKKYISLSVVITSVFSIYYAIKDPIAIRYARSNLYYGVGDFELVYASILIIGIVIIHLLHKNYIFNKKASLVFIVITSTFIIKSNFMTAIIMLLLVIVISIFVQKKKLKFMLYSFIGTIALVFIFRETVAQVLYYISENRVFDNIINEKITAIANFLNGGGELNTLGVRMELIDTSLTTFKENFLFGMDFKYYGAKSIGGHATWFDLLATVGIVGLSILGTFLYKTFKDVYFKCTNQINQECLILCVIIFIILGFLNVNMMGAIFAIIFLMIPDDENEKIKAREKNDCDNFI